MTLVAILWGSAFPVTRLLLEEMPPLGAAAWRTLLGRRQSLPAAGPAD